MLLLGVLAAAIVSSIHTEDISQPNVLPNASVEDLIIVYIVSLIVSNADVISKADTKIKDTIKNRKRNEHYWEAYVYDNYVEIGDVISTIKALKRVKEGKSVICAMRTDAYVLARSAAAPNKPYGPEIDKGKEHVIGFYYHYHISRENPSHIFYLR